MSPAPQQQPQQPKDERNALRAALASQQVTINALAHKVAVQDLLIDDLADLAGVGNRVTAIRKKADLDNPAQPIDNPPSEPATESTEEAATPEARDNVQAPGMTPGSVDNVAADTTDVALAPGASLPTAPFNQLVNPQAPVAGTETQLPLDQTRIETDVRVGDPTAPDVAYPWTIASAGGSRTTAAIHLARLQIETGVAEPGVTSDLILGGKIAASGVTDKEIESTIKTLESVRTASKRTASRPASLVPRAASAQQRTVPSLAGGGGIQAQASASPVSDDTADSDLFD